MPARRRQLALLVAAVLGLVATSVVPAGGATADPRVQRDAERAKKAQLARQLNALEASEDELEDAAKVLDESLRAATAQVAAARQAAAASEAELAAAQRAVDETKARIVAMTGVLVNRALARFMAPGDTDVVDLVGTGDLAATARKQTLLDTVAAKDRDLLDQLGALEEDLVIEQKAVEAANARTIARKRETEERLAALQRARAEKEKAAADVQRRQAEVLAEIEEHAKAEAELTRVINARARTGVGGDSAASSSGCIWPAKGRVTSEFGSRWGRLHAGIDIGAPVGTTVWATKAGEVIFAGVQSGYGNVIVVSHGGGLTSLYGHLSRIGVSDGQTVRQGQAIGAVGNTGRSTGPHVHFETRVGGSPRNPRSCLG